MSEEKIQTFCRMRPVEYQQVKYTIGDSEDGEYEVVEFKTAHHNVNPYAPTTEDNSSFYFNKIFDENVQQIDVFEIVAKEIVDHVLAGYNGTIFAYGQTGTGKTHTIVGKDSNFKNEDSAGIIPRSLDYIFSVLEEEDMETKMFLSYLEIYKGIGYDLLSGERFSAAGKKKAAENIDDLQLVVGRMGANKKLNLVNLSVIEVATKKEAMSAFALGSKNRKMAETSINDASSRSHCVFTVTLKTRLHDVRKVRTSKINFVDLAGSERVGKHHEMKRSLLLEARTINLSLHHLQQVIVALGKSQSTKHDRHIHVPFRNTMITNVLRESLGGNCKTRMIATVIPDMDNIQETLSTCKFSQRVANIENVAKVNLSVDYKALIGKLEEENAMLREELASSEVNSTLYDPGIPLTDDEKGLLKDLVAEFLENTDLNGDLIIDNDARKIQYCFKLLKYGVEFGKPKPLTKKEQLALEKENKRRMLLEQKEEELRRKEEEIKKKEMEQKRKQEQKALKNLKKKPETTPPQPTPETSIPDELKEDSIPKKENASNVNKPSKKEKDSKKEKTPEPQKVPSTIPEEPEISPHENGIVAPVQEEPVLSKKEQQRIEKENKKRIALEKKQETARQRELKKQEKQQSKKKGKNKDEEKSNQENEDPNKVNQESPAQPSPVEETTPKEVALSKKEQAKIDKENKNKIALEKKEEAARQKELKKQKKGKKDTKQVENQQDADPSPEAL